MDNIFNDFLDTIKVTTNSYNLINWLHERGINNVEYMILDSAFKGVSLHRLPHTLLLLEADFKRSIVKLTKLLNEYKPS